MAFVFGLTGGIACGKSTVSRYYGTLGVGIVDADIVARDVVRPGTPGLRAVVREFGEAILLPDGSLNRRAMGAIVFANPYWREILETLLQPYIMEGIELAVVAKSKDHDLVCIDAALFLEYGLQRRYKTVVLVALPKDMQVTRVMERDKVTVGEAEQRLASQWSHDKRVENLPEDHFLIWNTRHIAWLDEQARQVLSTLKSRLAAASPPPE